MDKLSVYAVYGVLLIGLFTVLGGLLFRRTFAVIRNIILSPIMGFCLALLAFVPQSATSLIQQVYFAVRSLIGEDWLALAGKLPEILMSLGVTETATKWFFLTGTLLSAALLAMAISFPIRGSIGLRIETMAVSAFVITLCVFIGFAAFNADFTSKAFFIVFLSLAVLLCLLQKFDFELVLIAETSLIGSLLLLTPVQVKFGLNYIIYLLFAALLCAVFIIIGTMIRGRKNGKQTA
ncbi:MAG: hypothetical protein PHO44_03650 [Sphaerochaetaceae bacterium]|jgi:hypothetical protein|nr:hypothetical protein [Sphaerochaetaceae bacterium]MDD3162714.1 hypothetical protein [Sphaerochaetaceae bacterium]MDD4007055.1 hypothetical protein [Sphaerochaetaceae bacterium]MDD4396689.1 hypothetical protein [Sphaerochaetaceae bacterium]